MTQTLKQGDRGALVSLLQLGLQRAGQTPGALDGIFGAQTAAAVRAFQARFPTVERIMRWTEAAECLLFTGIALHGVIRTCSGESTDNGFIMKLGAAVVALVLIAAGNQLPKLRRNSVSGARTKYSLSSDEAWYKTQRYVGRALMLAGATLLIVTLMPFITAGMACAATLAALVVVCAAALNYRG